MYQSQIPKLALSNSHHHHNPVITSIYDDLVNLSVYHHGSLTISQLLQNIGTTHPIIITSNSRSKLDIIHKIYGQLGIYDIGRAKPDQQINYDIMNIWFQKKTMDDDEISFLIKYMGHISQGLSVLDLNTRSDYKIYNTIKADDNAHRANIILATHGARLSMQNSGERSEYTTYMLDHERRYTSWLKNSSKAISISNIGYIIDNLIYKAEFLRDYIYHQNSDLIISLQRIAQYYTFWTGYINLEIDAYISQYHPNCDQSGKYELPIIYTNTHFAKSNTIYDQIANQLKSISDQEYKGYIDICDIIGSQITLIDHILQHPISVSKKTDNLGERFYEFFDNQKYIQYSEFLELMKCKRTIFLSHADIDTSKNIAHIDMHDIGSIDTNSKVYILVNNRDHGKKISDYYISQHYPYIYGENILGGHGKIASMISGKSNFVVCGGYEMFFYIINSGIKLDHIYYYSNLGLLHKHILRDMYFWYQDIYLGSGV